MNTFNGSISEYIDHIENNVLFGKIICGNDEKYIKEAIEQAVKNENIPLFRTGLSARLNELGFECSEDDIIPMTQEIKRRFKSVLEKECPKAVVNWIKGTAPGYTNLINNYDLCYALEADVFRTEMFFHRYYLTLAFNCKNRIETIFFYCIYNHKPYSDVKKFIELSEEFEVRECAHTSTSEIRAHIKDIDNDDEFLKYLSVHCFDNEQQFQTARTAINKEVDIMKKSLTDKIRTGKGNIQPTTPDRLNSLMVSELLGFKYQNRNSAKTYSDALPKRFTRSLPNDVTIKKILNGENATYESMRKLLMLLRFYNLFDAAYDNKSDITDDDIRGICLDFHDGLDDTLNTCGFAPINMCDPFDCLLMYCAVSDDPVTMLYEIIECGRN